MISPFEDFPVEFKQINPSDFPDFDVEEKINIVPNEEGYIKDPLKAVIELDSKNTVIINAGVGQGKTHAILDIVKDYYQDPQNVIFIASPFVSLVEQYYQDTLKLEIDPNDVFRYESLGDEQVPRFWSKRIHIVTANCLLGNPGEDAFINSERKRYYLDTLKEQCERRNKKVIFVYDEIHDAIHNFKEQYIFNLWKWRNVIHKNFIISATFNEASKVVIEYLSELTDRKIQIIEATRTRFPEKQSELYLHYNDEKFYTYNDPIIASLVKELISKGKEIDILCYSKILSNDIINNKDVGVGYELYQKYHEINNCTSELVFNKRQDRAIPQNRYNASKCNVGTNFKTGVSIKKENHAFIIILPPKGAKTPFSNNYGIFTHAVNSIIQALARQRIKGEIHLILPKPYDFDFTTLPFEEEEQLDYFKNFYNKIKDGKLVEKQTKYLPLAQQDEILFDFYENTLKKNIVHELEYVNSLPRENKVRLSFPEYKLYKLEKSEDYFAEKTQFFGGDLAAYITYCAVTNQFLNCKFQGATGKLELSLKFGQIQQGLMDFCTSTNFFSDDRMSLYNYLNDTAFYNHFREDLFSEYYIKLITSDGKIVNLLKDGSSEASKYFENQLLGFVQNLRKPNNPTNKFKFKTDDGFKDGSYDRRQYFLEAISQAKVVTLDEFASENTKNRVRAFKYLELLRSRMIESKQEHNLQNGNKIYYLSNKPTPLNHFIRDNETDQFNNLISEITDESNSINKRFSLKTRFLDKSLASQKVILYKILLEDFFSVKDYRIPTGTRDNVKKVEHIIPLPSHTHLINLLQHQDYDFPLNFEPKELTPEEIKKIQDDQQ